MIGIVELIAIAIAGGAGYLGYENLIKDKLDTPKNSEAVKGLDKGEVKAKIKEDETKKKELDKEIKALDQERKVLIKDETKKDEAQEKLEEKEAKQEEVKELETGLVDLKAVDKGGYWGYAPKVTLNNGLWLGGSLIGLVVLFKLAIGVISSVFPKLGWES